MRSTRSWPSANGRPIRTTVRTAGRRRCCSAGRNWIGSFGEFELPGLPKIVHIEFNRRAECRSVGGALDPTTSFARIAGMSEPLLPSPSSPRSPTSTGPLPEVHLEVRHKGAAPVSYAVPREGFLIGTVPGCDLRLRGAD